MRSLIDLQVGAGEEIRGEEVVADPPVFALISRWRVDPKIWM